MEKKKKHHEINLGDLQDWLGSSEMTYADSTRECKRLTCDSKGTLKVYVGNVVTWQGLQPYSAVEAYNSVTEKYINPNKDFRI